LRFEKTVLLIISLYVIYNMEKISYLALVLNPYFGSIYIIIIIYIKY